MTTIHMDWGRLELRAEGHAGAGTAGNDLICAGISAITGTLAQYLLRYEWLMRPEIEMEPGQCRIRAKPLPGRRRQAQEAYRMAMDGLEMLARQFPDHVRTEED